MPKNLSINLNQLENIAQQYGTPFQLYDKTLIIEHAKNFLNKFKSKFSNFKQYFAVKALPNPNILKILFDEGFGFDCSSVEEIKVAKSIGASGNDIIYTSNYTSSKDLAFAIEEGIKLFLLLFVFFVFLVFCCFFI
jgi:diaminopimelate decarboxylase